MRISTAIVLTMIAMAVIAMALSSFAWADETIVLMRHGEKPKGGLGQLSCKGFERALELPKVLNKKFRRPIAIFAPNPGIGKKDSGMEYSYVRPLATIEPTAVFFGMPVRAEFGFSDVNGLSKAALSKEYDGGTVFVAWEHHKLVDAAKEMVKELGGNEAVVPDWPRDDFDSLYVIRKTRVGVSFARERENLNSSSATCAF